ncbi:hypothetical protein Pcinc_013535 [Petrolisthes cinctipes]|uniref:Uncharacterized protein n=1 Tax=Petrolisthes cinctipes TaxID=88211 RepID=A0AAE1KQ86_PETCI|nr:hypothetical protein Pcinc_013535 [Petrolisthes cinctipes]
MKKKEGSEGGRDIRSEGKNGQGNRRKEGEWTDGEVEREKGETGGKKGQGKWKERGEMDRWRGRDGERRDWREEWTGEMEGKRGNGEIEREKGDTGGKKRL